MKKWITHTARLLYFVAGFIFAIHQVTPHSHHEDLSSTEDHSFHEEETDSFHDFLQLIFHTKVSQDDFSQLHKSEQKVVKHLLSVVSVLPQTYFSLEKNGIPKQVTFAGFAYKNNSFSKEFLLDSFSLRGPPSVFG